MPRSLAGAVGVGGQERGEPGARPGERQSLEGERRGRIRALVEEALRPALAFLEAHGAPLIPHAPAKSIRRAQSP